MATGWYVLHIYSGYENKIEKTIRMMIEMGELEKEIVRDVKIPSEEIVEVKDGKMRTLAKKFLPGYILVEMDLPDADMGWKIPCSKIKKIQGVTGFVGTMAGRKPQPLTSDEARAILQKRAGRSRSSAGGKIIASGSWPDPKGVRMTLAGLPPVYHRGV